MIIYGWAQKSTPRAKKLAREERRGYINEKAKKDVGGGHRPPRFGAWRQAEGVEHMRRKDREMGRGFALGVLDKAEWMTLAMTDGEGKPYCVPVSLVRDGEELILHSAMLGEKAECLRARPEVCITAVGDTHVVPEEYTTEYESAIVRGRAREITDPQEKLAALWTLTRRYCPEHLGQFDQMAGASLKRTAVFRIVIQELTGKRKKYGKDGKELKFGAEE